ncbi:MAG: LPS export ABC transporter permease LptF [Porticoccaceae bacterium]
MIIFRYLARDLLATTAAVCAVLLMVVMSSRFVKYLADAAAGQLDTNILFAVIGYRLPGFIELILPLAFFLAVLLAYGRLYLDNEMTVLHACGVSPARITAYTLVLAVLVALAVAWLSLSVSPSGLARADVLLDSQKQRGEFEGMEAGKFYPMRGGRGVSYAESVTEDGVLEDIFIIDSTSAEGEDPQIVAVVADRGTAQGVEGEKASFLVLENGQRYQGVPGRAEFQVTRFAEYGQRLSSPSKRSVRANAESLATAELRQSDKLEHIAALQWRYSTPLLVLVVTLIAIPLSRTNPRQGRFAKILPAVVLYILYLVGLNAARGGVEEGDISPFFGLWWVHLVFLIIGLALMAWTFGWKASRWAASLGLARRESPLIVSAPSVDENPQAGVDERADKETDDGTDEGTDKETDEGEKS